MPDDAALDAIAKIRDNIASVYFGDPERIDRILACVLARGHVLIEDVPGVGKTLLATALARSIDASFSRVQLTPDLLPADIIGVTVYDREGSAFQLKKGPIFANVVLADEINRATPRTQTALLEAMNDGTVSIDGTAHRLEQPFVVLATQNPTGFSGTYELPENQLDRFLMCFSLGYPGPEDEAGLLEARPADTQLASLRPVIDPAGLLGLSDGVDAVAIADELRRYIVELANATRTSPALELGLSPRGSLALAQAARATAFIAGRDYVVPDDIYDNAVPVCAHRIVPAGHRGSSTRHAAAEALRETIQAVASP